MELKSSPLHVLILYAGIVVVDTLALQPYIMKRTTKVSIWASILVPIVLAFVIPILGRVSGGAITGGGLRVQASPGAREQKR